MNRHIRIPLIILLLLSLSFTARTDTLPPPIRIPGGIVVRCSDQYVRVLVRGERTLRISVSADSTFSFKPSLVVLQPAAKARFAVTTSDSFINLKTASLEARLDRRTGALSFYRIDGEFLVKERQEHPHILEPAVVAGESVYHVTQTFALSAGEGIYGLGQFEDGVMNYRNHCVTLIQNNRHIVTPFLVSSRRYGVYWDNYSHTEFRDDPGGTSFWSEVADGIDYYFISGGTIDEVIAGYRDLTGRVPMFPRWAFGYWQSKERYETQQEVLDIAREYRERRIPVDNIVQDWQYWGRLGWNAMAFDDSAYPNPKAMIDSLHREYHLQLMLSVWPQVDSSRAVYRELSAAGLLYPTEIWNGGKTYDAYSDKAREVYWKHLNNGLYSLGVDAWWVDATEPDWKWCDSLLEEKEGIVRNGMTAIGTSSRYLNTYALMATKGIYEHQRATNPDRRVVMLTRSAFCGQQRNSMAVWSGDISSNWMTFRNQIAAGLNFSIAGIPYWNSDIGGFLPKEYGGEYPLGPRDPSYRELYVRWFQFGAFCPIFRAHGTDFPREIWRFGGSGDWAFDALVKYDRLRYRLLPYIYSVAWMVTSQQYTMMRPLVMDFPADPNVASIGNEYLFGPSILAPPVTREMYFPRNPAAAVPAACLRTANGKQGLEGEYYRGLNFDSLAYVRRDTLIDFNWTETGAPGVGRDSFTVRWKGRINPPESGMYQFEVPSDDGVNLWVGGKRLLDEMYPAGLQRNVNEISLAADTSYEVVFEYQQVDRRSQVALMWRTPSMLSSYAPTPEIKKSDVYLPAGPAWYDFWTGEGVEGGKHVARPAPIDIMPLYVRAGSILPLGPVVQYASERQCDTLELRIYSGADAQFSLYEDENDGYGYEKGMRAVIPISWDDARRILTVGKREGRFPGMPERRTFRVVLVRSGHGAGPEEAPDCDTSVDYAGTRIRVAL